MRVRVCMRVVFVHTFIRIVWRVCGICACVCVCERVCTNESVWVCALVHVSMCAYTCAFLLMPKCKR